jgi:hypothetical protein
MLHLPLRAGDWALPESAREPAQSGEIGRGGVGAAEDYDDSLVGLWAVDATEEGGLGCGAAVLDREPVLLPQLLPGGDDRVLIYEERLDALGDYSLIGESA